ncbi:radical SAM protein [Aminipila butyrica]|uniref:FeMo cofactor biosynthesis protein NifB n=1 Tax=Aminipila butyrica TaxID=433296 RepID=A0A858BSD3_9FIRM|nr:radical SAM protein [Aminipila butyrica]QIB67968.1 radical SAM protein [Aminipila butyrica]
MGFSYDELTVKHPCFAKGKKGNTGRIHLPTSPGCNIECRFCDRQINDFERRPGVTSTIITPEEAIDIIRRSLEMCQAITVVGIAGPGDTLATPYALETFRLVKREFPQLIKCMSTNGLLLPDKAEEIIEVGIDSLTVTVNGVDPEIEAKLNGGITYHGKYYGGVEGAKILIANQLEGIRRIASAGITIKVNTVLVPGINEHHIGEVARAVREAGASIYNIIPLVPQHELAHCQAPTCQQTDSARQQAEPYIDVFRHCQRCRADAIGVPGGEDFGDKIYLKRISHKDTFSHG